MVPELIQVAQALSPNSTLIIYSLDLSGYQFKEVNNVYFLSFFNIIVLFCFQITNFCNDSCEVIKFQFDRFPSHIRDIELQAYRPIIIQVCKSLL